LLVPNIHFVPIPIPKRLFVILITLTLNLVIWSEGISKLPMKFIPPYAVCLTVHFLLSILIRSVLFPECYLRIGLKLDYSSNSFTYF